MAIQIKDGNVAMMGEESSFQPKLFYHQINLEQRVSKNHLLRKIQQQVLYNVRSERELMETIPLRLDRLWFLGYDLDGEVPDHSVLSKARTRWGVEAFRNFFERIVWQGVEAGLVDGSEIFVDSSLVNADASNNSVVDTQSLKVHLRENYKK